MSLHSNPLAQTPQWALIIFIVSALISAITDYRNEKIYNALTFPLLIFGFIVSALQTPSLWLISVASIFFAFVIYLPLVWFKLMGAGDAKLTMALSTVLGLKGTWELFYYSLLIAAFGALAILIRNKRVGVFLHELKLLFQSIFYRELQFHWPRLDMQSKSPFGVTIFLAFLILLGRRLHA